MKTALITTLHFYSNFGSVLQAYALRRTLEKLGYAADILPYRPRLPEYTYFQDPNLQQAYDEKRGKFADFRRRFLGMEQDTDRIGDCRRDYDAYIAGSDIVWGREFSGLDPAYFLEFAPEGRPKIAYAAGVILTGNGRTEDDSLFAERLPYFDALSVRESSSVSTIQRFTNQKVIAVLDPTLLLTREEYAPLEIECGTATAEPYLLSYFLTHDPAVVDYTNLLAKKLGLRIIHYFADYPGRVFPQDAGSFAFAGPGEFLSLVKNAACVFTNSFHGTCFAMIYRRPFYTYMAKRAMLSRVRDTVGRLGMEDRFFAGFQDLARVSPAVDYAGMESRLPQERTASLAFLSNALEGRSCTTASMTKSSSPTCTIRCGNGCG